MSRGAVIEPPRRARRRSSSLRALALAAGLAGAVTPGGWAAGPATDPAGWPPDPSLIIEPAEIPVPQDLPTQAALRAAHPGLRRLAGESPGWTGTIDPLTGSIDRAFGSGLAGGVAADSRGEPGRAFLVRHRDLFAPGLEQDGSELVLADTRALAGGEVRTARYELRRDGLPVLGAGLTLGLRDGDVVLVTTRALAPVTASSRPVLDARRALASVERHLAAGGTPIDLETRREASLAFLPRVETTGARAALRHHLVWVIAVKPPPAPWHDWHVAWVDAHDGEVLALFPESRHAACTADPSRARATVRGGVRPNRADDPETILNLPFVRTEVAGRPVTTSVNGRFPYTGGGSASALDGTFFRSRCDNCILPANPLAAGDASGDIDFGTGGSSGPIPVVGNGTSTPADRTAFYHLNHTRQLLSKWDNTVPDEVEVFVNIGSTCNAFSNAHLLGFFNSGSNCRNTGEIRDVVHHELGHTWDRFDGNQINSGSLSEWKGDLLAILIGGDACIGESFRITNGFPTAGCSGVREVDEKATGRNNHPVSPSCPTCPVLTTTSNGCGVGVHCNGEIAGQATIHLLSNLMTGLDYATGAALPAGNPPFTVEQSRWLLERLLLAGGPPMETLDPAVAGLSIYDAVMLIDDEDGNLSNGTPHAAYVNAAFTHHVLAESPMVPDAANCAGLSEPAVTATTDREPGTGLPLVRLEWTPDAGTTYDVYRNTRAGDGFLPVARGLSAGSFEDTGVQTGLTYRYWVAAVRTTGCAAVSPGTGVVAVMVSDPELRVDSRSFTETPGASDGDGLIEPGEKVTAQITLGERGGMSGATNVTATLASFSSASPITSAGPVTYGSVPAGATSPGTGTFEVFVGPSEVCGGAVHLVLSMTGNEGCWQDGLELPIASTGCATHPSAFVEMVPGSEQVIGSSGDADGIPDNCEAVTVGYQIRNSGSLAAGPVTSTVTTTHPDLTFSPEPVCTLAGLAPAATAPCAFTFSLGDAPPAGLPFTITTTSAGNPAPSVRGIELGTEADPPVFGTLAYGFDGSFEGWTAREFELSTARIGSGSHSAHSGSTTQPNICGKLTSPPLLLSPMTVSTLTFRIFAEIEPFTDTWYDRANVHVVDVETGWHTVVAPSSGPAYNATGNRQVGLCHNSNQDGWGGSLGGFHTITMDLSSWAGRVVRIEVNYGTDEGDDREGLYVDDVSITNATAGVSPPDPQPDLCSVPEVSPAAAIVPLDLSMMPGGTIRFTWEHLGAGYQYNLYSGGIGAYYSHGAGASVCEGAGAGVTCAGPSCALDAAGPGQPAGDLYFLVTAAAFGREGTSGFTSAGAERDPLESTCAP